ncbi:MAG: transglutaminase-like domain-containing protein [Betaproteobacteria bacterium]|nr:transglutaminase-like domain-containing protein [Betaproteobacteria bacterium]
MKLHDRILQAILNAAWLRGRELFAAQLAASIAAQISEEQKSRLDSRLRGNDGNDTVVPSPSSDAVVPLPSFPRRNVIPAQAGTQTRCSSPSQHLTNHSLLFGGVARNAGMVYTTPAEAQSSRCKGASLSMASFPRRRESRRALSFSFPMWFGHRIFRTIATIAIAAMVNLTVHPLAVAMTLPKPVNTAAWKTVEASPDRQLVELIDTVRATLMSPADSVMRKEFNPQAALDKFDALTEKINASMEAQRKAAVGDTTKLDALKQQFASRSQTFRDKLQAMVPQGLIFKTAKSDGADLTQWLDQVSPLKKPESLKEMPFQTLKPNRNNVPQEFTSPLPIVGEGQGERDSNPIAGEGAPQGREKVSTPPLPIVGEGLGERGLPLTTKAGSEVNDPQYLASTAETEITADIRAQAQALNNNAVEIYNWVRNNVEWQPTWGGQQTADMTLDVKRGNAMDIATLTIALLRAANIPARYAYGTVDIPAAQFINMAGDFANIDAAWDFASAGGIPITGITSGGVVSKIRMQHVWVEAAVPYYPSRGAKPASNKTPIDTWVPLDPSYKQYDYLQGIDTQTIANIDGQQLADNFINSGTVNEQEGWVQGLDSNIIANAQTQAQQNLTTYINGMQNPTVGDVIGGRTIKQQTLNILPGTLPYVAAAKGATYAQLPANLQVQVTLGLGWDIYDLSWLQSVTMPLYQLNQRSITISFKPASTADENALAALIPANITDPSQLPSFLPSSIRVIPEIKRDDQVLLSAGAMALGEEIDIGTSFQTSTQTWLDTKQDSVIAGSYLALGIVGSNPSQKTFSALQGNLTQTKQILESGTDAQKAALTREKLLGDMYVVGIQGYYAEYIPQSRIMSLKAKTPFMPIPTMGTFGYEPYQSTLFGINRGIEVFGMYMNVYTAQVIKDKDGNSDKAKQLMLQAGMLSSALESSVPELIFYDPNSATQSQGFSTAKALNLAAMQGQKIYTITQQNQSAALSVLHLDSLAMSEIRDALASAKEVITHTDQLTVTGFRGSGYAITDPTTGAGIYKISGGKNGGYMGAALGVATATSVLGLIPIPNPGTIATVLESLIFPVIAVALAACAGFLTGLIILDVAQGIKGPVNTANCFISAFLQSFFATLGLEGAFLMESLVLTKIKAVILAVSGAAATVAGNYLPSLVECGVLPKP